MQRQNKRPIEWANDQRNAVWLAVHDSLIPGLSEELRDRRFDWCHPLLELRLREFDGCDSGRNLEDVLLDRSLEISSRCFGETLLVFLEHAGKAVELIHSPLIGLRGVGVEVCFLLVEQVLSKTSSRAALGGLREVRCCDFNCSSRGFHLSLRFICISFWWNHRAPTLNVCRLFESVSPKTIGRPDWGGASG